MTKVRRLMVVLAGLAVTAVLSTQLWGDNTLQKGRSPILPADGSRPAAGDGEADLAKSRFAEGGVLAYQPKEGDAYFALQLKPKLDPVPRRPRDYLLLVSTSAGQAGAAWTAAKQITEAVVKDATKQDRVSVWTVSTPEAKFTRCLTKDFLSPQGDQKKMETALKELENQYPAGDTDLKSALASALKTFDAPAENRQRILLYLGDGLSTHIPLKAADRLELSRQMVEGKITFFSIPLGMKLSPENLHGLANGTGGAVVRVQLLDERLPEAMKSLEAAFATPVLYPERLQMPAGVSEHYPTLPPPLRADSPTLVMGRMKLAKALHCTVTGTVAGQGKRITVTVEEPVREPDVDNFFLVAMAQQWQKARDQHALIRADRALVLAYENHRLKHKEILESAQVAMQENELEAAARLFQQAKQFSPLDVEADAGLKLVGALRDGKLTRAALQEQLNKAGRKVNRIDKKGGLKRMGKEEMVALLQKIDAAKGVGMPPAGRPEAGPRDENDLLKAHRDLMIVEEQKMAQGVEAALRQARRDMTIDPDAAYESVKNTLLRVRDHPDLGERVRDELTRRLQNNLRDLQMQGAQVKLRRAQERDIAAVATANVEKDMQHKAEQDQIEARFRIYKNLMNQARLERHTHEKVLAGLSEMQREAELQGRAAPLGTQAAYLQVSASYNLHVQQELRRRRELGFLSVLLEVEKSHVPYPDEPPIHFPPLATWQAITKLRKEKYEVTSLPDDREGRKAAQKINKLLDETIDMKEFQLPMTLKEALGLLQDKLNVKYKDEDALPILVDDSAFKEANPDAPDIYETPVKFPPFPRRMSVATALRLTLSKVPTNNATYLIRRNFIEITTVDRQVAERVLTVYPVGDLVLPISSPTQRNPFNPYANAGFGGAIGGGLGALGGGLGALGGGLGALGGGLGGLGGGLGGLGGGLGGLGGGLGGLGGGFGGLGGGLGGLGGGLGGLGGGLGGLGGGLGGLGGGLGGLGGLGGGLGGLGGGLGGLGGLGGGLGGLGGLGGQLGQQGQNCLGFNQFNGGLGRQGSTMDQGLILLIQQVVAPGEWGAQRCQMQQGFAGLPGAGPGGGLPGGPAVPNDQGGPALDIKNSNTIGFYPPALALVVRGTSRIHTKITGGITSAKKEMKEAGEVGARNPNLVAVKPIKKPGFLEVANASGEDNDPAKKKRQPVVKSAAPGDKDAEDLDARKIWQDALTKGVDDPGMIIATADFLFEHQKYDHAAEFLKANLRQGIIVRPWVYEALAVALEAGGTAHPDEVRRVRLSAISLNPKDSQGYLKAARAMADYKQWDRAVAYCKEAAALDPNSPYPYADALDYAELAKDSKGMEWAAGNLLSQEWPVDSAGLHLKAQAKLEALASDLESGSRKAEAEHLRAALEKVRERDLIISLKWEAGRSGPADLDLEVKEPSGSVCSSQQRQTPGGGAWTSDLLTGKTHVSYAAAKAFTGEYELTVRRIWGEPLGMKARLEIVQHQGTPQEVRRIESVTISSKTTLKVTLKVGRRTDLAVVSSAATAPRSQPRNEEVKERRILATLADIADPFYAGPSPQRMTASAGRGAYMDPIAMPLKNLPGQAKGGAASGLRAFQTAVVPMSGTGVNLAATATVSADANSIRLSLTPMFRGAGNSALSRPTFNNPLIPGGVSP